MNIIIDAIEFLYYQPQQFHNIDHNNNYHYSDILVLKNSFNIDYHGT